MNDGYIRNRKGTIIGRKSADGWTRDGTGKLVAHENADGFTRNREGKIVGEGDQTDIELGRRNPDPNDRSH